jgi:hypothetical protein
VKVLDQTKTSALLENKESFTFCGTCEAYPILGRRELQYIVWLLGSSKKDLGQFFSDLTTARRKESIDGVIVGGW